MLYNPIFCLIGGHDSKSKIFRSTYLSGWSCISGETYPEQTQNIYHTGKNLYIMVQIRFAFERYLSVGYASPSAGGGGGVFNNVPNIRGNS